jgi:hypothetical protein
VSEQHDWHVYAWRWYCHNYHRQYDHHVGRYWVDRLNQLVDGELVRVGMMP